MASWRQIQNLEREAERFDARGLHDAAEACRLRADRIRLDIAGIDPCVIRADFRGVQEEDE